MSRMPGLRGRIPGSCLCSSHHFWMCRIATRLSSTEFLITLVWRYFFYRFKGRDSPVYNVSVYFISLLTTVATEAINWLVAVDWRQHKLAGNLPDCFCPGHISMSDLPTLLGGQEGCQRTDTLSNFFWQKSGKSFICIQCSVIPAIRPFNNFPVILFYSRIPEQEQLECCKW